MSAQLKNVVEDIKDLEMQDIKGGVQQVLSAWADETSNGVKLGFTIASALAWNEVLKVMVSNFGKQNTLRGASMHAGLVTLITAVVFMIIGKPKKVLKIA